MSYKVHKLDVEKRIDPERLENFLNGLSGEVISIIPNTSLKINVMGSYGGINYLVVIEKVKL